MLELPRACLLADKLTVSAEELLRMGVVDAHERFDAFRKPLMKPQSPSTPSTPQHTAEFYSVGSNDLTQAT